MSLEPSWLAEGEGERGRLKELTESLRFWEKITFDFQWCPPFSFIQISLSYQRLHEKNRAKESVGPFCFSSYYKQSDVMSFNDNMKKKQKEKEKVGEDSVNSRVWFGWCSGVCVLECVC